MDTKVVLQGNWKKLINQAVETQDKLQSLQGHFKKKLCTDVIKFVHDIKDFRKDYEENGPMVVGLNPNEANEKLKK